MSRAATRRRSVVVAVLAVLAVGGAGVAVAASRSGDAATGDASVAAPSTPAGASSTAPSAGATGGADDGATTGSPAEPTTAGGASTPTPSGGTTTAGRQADVVVVSTYSGWDPTASAVVTGGYVADLVEDGGTCSLTLSRDGVVLTGGESAATPDVASTSCGEVRLTGAELTAGSWEAVLRYSSPDAVGESAPFPVVVP
ncbi:hypothetical protein SAMN05660464_1638 [Geodermatophilus dictyosporus]|uniref:Uncharacterized protein n=1 Tax=Geodermatophilus dictyosporus TaxID=1523247 RepID=A0A1I5LAB9_9ACTN|nr:hypothetical protein [Geodermatophilus dictyosporus]SFO94168.1 hypothetical protein SAMN05660464_1638 [Geodermatophilus dictyosporus]